MESLREMNFRLICWWSDGATTTSMHSSQALAERKISNLNYRWKKNRLLEKPLWAIHKKMIRLNDKVVWWNVVNEGTYKK